MACHRSDTPPSLSTSRATIAPSSFNILCFITFLPFQSFKNLLHYYKTVLMRSGVRCSRLFLARSADYPFALIRPFIKTSRRAVAGSTPTQLTFRQSSRTFTSMSSADQAQPDKAPTPASAEAPEAETAGSSTPAKAEPELPPLSPQEFRAYNRLAETMDYFVCSIFS